MANTIKLFTGLYLHWTGCGNFYNDIDDSRTASNNSTNGPKNSSSSVIETEQRESKNNSCHSINSYSYQNEKALHEETTKTTNTRSMHAVIRPTIIGIKKQFIFDIGIFIRHFIF